MNLYFLDQPYLSRPLSQLSKTARFHKIGMGDIVFFVLERRLVMVVLNRSLTTQAVVTDFPRIAQVLDEKESEFSDLDLKPILFYDDHYSKTIHDIRGLQYLSKLFQKNPLALKIIKETVSLLYHKISQRDASIMVETLSTKTSIPGIKSSFRKEPTISDVDHISGRDIKQNEITSNNKVGKPDSLVTEEKDEKSGRLYIVEKFFTPRMKKEFYDYLALGYSEKDALRKIRMAHPKMLLGIHEKLKRENREFMSRI